MMKRVLLAGVLGGIAMFVWSSIAHVALPLGKTGIKEIPNEQAVLSGMQAQLGGTSGLYAFPEWAWDRTPHARKRMPPCSNMIRSWRRTRREY